MCTSCDIILSLSITVFLCGYERWCMRILINKTSLICSVCIRWNVYCSNINNYANSGMYVVIILQLKNIVDKYYILFKIFGYYKIVLLKWKRSFKQKCPQFLLERTEGVCGTNCKRQIVPEPWSSTRKCLFSMCTKSILINDNMA